MFFNFKREETPALKAFQRANVKRGVRLDISERTAEGLKAVADAIGNGEPPQLSSTLEALLLRHGFVMHTGKGLKLTEIGIIATAFCEAAGLVSIKGAVVPMKGVK